MWHYGWDSAANPLMWLGMAIGFIIMLIFLGLLIWFIVAISRKNDSASSTPSTSRAVELLKERYARGEINTEEFRERLLELEENKRLS